jgi:hypothetical protein
MIFAVSNVEDLESNDNLTTGLGESFDDKSLRPFARSKQAKTNEELVSRRSEGETVFYLMWPSSTTCKSFSRIHTFNDS